MHLHDKKTYTVSFGNFIFPLNLRIAPHSMIMIYEDIPTLDFIVILSFKS